MTHPMTSLRALLGAGKSAVRPRPQTGPGRNVMMHITLDAQHATPLRQALTRDCGDQPWTIRVAPLAGTGRVRLSLYLPRTAVDGAIQRVAHLAPTAELGQLFEVPDTPTDSWRGLMHADSAPRVNPADAVAAAAGEEQTDATAELDSSSAAGSAIARLISPEHVLLGLDVANRQDLFVALGRFFEQHYALPAAVVTAGLEAREAMGSTGLGQGVAVPHGQIKGLRHAMVLYVRPARPIPFDAPDGKPVSDIVVLLVPKWANSTHLRLLADVAERFCDHQFREQLHACDDATAVCQLFVDYVAD
ncbi:PTS sugar transporter subunit IIA [Paraburkholderia phenazinium]|uniref:PTS sugar transporter subunit IIA n=1 Tax=Paraburkholderia phenazinium TaxID=60549 RepID=UPI001588E112|nr:PTS sugar transporter subunit IIA [Paraburkholderia phenazinium]